MKNRNPTAPNRVYTCKADMTPGGILKWVSVDSGKICLPCNITLPIKNTARDILEDLYVDNGAESVEDSIERAESVLQLLVFAEGIHASIYLTLRFVDGETVTKWLPDVMGWWYSRPILQEFFQRGGAGLTDEMREIWERRFSEFQDRLKYWYRTDYDIDETVEDPIMLPQTEITPYHPDN